MAGCAICNHPDRAAIEIAVLNCTGDKNSLTLQQIANNYNVSLNELKIHMVMHATMGIHSLDDPDPTDSTSTETEPKSTIARKCKVREADVLGEVINEYLVTMKNLGRRINKSLQSDFEEVQAEKMITKPITDMYLGLGGEIRNTVKTLSDLNSALNGPQQNANSGILALAQAIQGSQQLAIANQSNANFPDPFSESDPE